MPVGKYTLSEQRQTRDKKRELIEMIKMRNGKTGFFFFLVFF